MKHLDLRVAKDCREFLASIKIDERPITGVYLDSGAFLSLDKMTDEEAIQHANELYFNKFGGAKKGGVVDTRLVLDSASDEQVN